MSSNGTCEPEAHAGGPHGSDRREQRDQVLKLIADLLSRNLNVKMKVTGASMAPALLSGDVVTIEPAAARVVKPGDIVFCRVPGLGWALHRVVRVRRRRGDSKVQTMGDALREPDAAVKGGDVLGIAASVSRKEGEINLRRPDMRRRSRLLAWRKLCGVMARKIWRRLSAA